MATGGHNEVGWNLVTVGNLKLEDPNKTPNYNSIVICQNKIIVVDFDDYKVKIHRLHDGKLLDKLDSDSRPRAICLMDATTICVLHLDGLIEMASIKSENMSPVFTRMKRFRLHGVFDLCHSVARVNDDIVVVGVKENTTYWCITSLDDGHVDTIHRICKKSIWSDVTTKDNIIYISCYVGVDDDDTGVYGFDILNPSQCKYKYKHERLRSPRSIVINEDGNIFVGDFEVFGNHGVFDSCIHQLTSSCQLVAIFTSQEIPRNLKAMLWDNGRLYVTSWWSHDITVFRHVYQGSHKASEVLASHERKLPGIEESAIQISQGNVDNGQSSVETETPPSVPSPEDSEDEKHGNHTVSEVPISDEGKQRQEIPIEQSVEENLNRAGIMMSKEERDLFITFQKIIGTDIYFSKGPHRLNDGQETLKATDTFFEQICPDMKDKWLEYKSQGKLTPELIDVIYSKERNPKLHHRKDEILRQMEVLNIIVKARSFDENGVKEDNYFFTPCMLRLDSTREVVAPEQDPRMLSSSTLCWVFARTFLPACIFDGIIAACLARWPVAKKKVTSKHLLSHGSTVFDLDLTHRLTLNCEKHVISAIVTWLVIDDITTPDAKLCTRVRMFISRQLSKIINSLKQNIPYKLNVQIQESQDGQEDNRIHLTPFLIWFEDEIHDPDSPITPDHMNHARLSIALVTVCGKALREMLLDNFPVPYKDIYQAILANQSKLIGVRGRPILNQEQINLVFIDPLGQQTGTVEMFDISLLYTLIQNVSTVQAPITGWGIDPQPCDTSLGASVERIRTYKNCISGHSPDAKMNHEVFEYYWQKLEDVLHDIEFVINRHVYSTELERQKRQVISIFDAC